MGVRCGGLGGWVGGGGAASGRLLRPAAEAGGRSSEDRCEGRWLEEQRDHPRDHAGSLVKLNGGRILWMHALRRLVSIAKDLDELNSELVIEVTNPECIPDSLAC